MVCTHPTPESAGAKPGVGAGLEVAAIILNLLETRPLPSQNIGSQEVLTLAASARARNLFLF